MDPMSAIPEMAMESTKDRVEMQDLFGGQQLLTEFTDFQRKIKPLAPEELFDMLQGDDEGQRKALLSCGPMGGTKLEGGAEAKTRRSVVVDKVDESDRTGVERAKH